MDLRELPDFTGVSRHPWEVVRARFLSGIAAQGLPGRQRVLDVGAGDGYVARELLARLPAGSEVHCFDVLYTEASLDRARAGAPAALRFEQERPAGPFDLVLLLDVLEHVPDDRAFLREIVRDLRPGGRVLVSVPAWMALYSRHDRALGHYRRYRPAELRALVEGAGLALERTGGLFHSLLVARALAKLGERARGLRSRPAPAFVPHRAETGLHRWRGGPGVTRAACAALAVDTWLSGVSERAGLGVPGLTAWALARKG